jgi:hypothetical protein
MTTQDQASSVANPNRTRNLTQDDFDDADAVDANGDQAA